MPADDGMLSSHEIKLALGGLRFDKDLNVGWQITPSIGLVAKDIDRLGLAISSFEEPLKRSVITVMIPSIRKNFEQGGRPDKWEKLAPYTLQQKGLLGISDGDLPLTRTGALKRGATQFSIWDIGRTSATIRKLPDNVWYGAVHQQGIGSFSPFVEAAKKALGPKAGGLAILKKAFKLMDEARGPGGHRAIHIPQRQFILFQENDIDDIYEVFYEWLVEQTILVGRFRG
jgi:phage gpG-like protein